GRVHGDGDGEGSDEEPGGPASDEPLARAERLDIALRLSASASRIYEAVAPGHDLDEEEDGIDMNNSGDDRDARRRRRRVRGSQEAFWGAGADADEAAPVVLRGSLADVWTSGLAKLPDAVEAMLPARAMPLAPLG
ncbi:hypothetical protein HK405_011286, partial [Cladochytrium tenue]